MFTDPRLQHQLNRLRHDELVREAEHERLARQIQSTPRVASAIWPSLRGLAAWLGASYCVRRFELERRLPPHQG